MEEEEGGGTEKSQCVCAAPPGKRRLAIKDATVCVMAMRDEMKRRKREREWQRWCGERVRFVRVIGRERPRSSGEEREDIEWTVDEWCKLYCVLLRRGLMRGGVCPQRNLRGEWP